MRKIMIIIGLFFVSGMLFACESETASEQVQVTASTPTPTRLLEQSNQDVSGHKLTAEQLKNFERFIEDERNYYQIPGLAVALVQGNKIVLAQGFGVQNLDEGDPVTKETLFHIGSTHKSITAMFIATLVDDGLLEWDTPLVEFVPDIELADDVATSQVTIRHFLGMSSGIPDDAEGLLDLENATAEDIFDLVAEAELLGLPGEVFSYSNPSSAISGYAGVLAAGGTFGDLYEGYVQNLQARIFDPIGMTTATLSVEEVLSNPNMSASHIFEDGDIVVAESYDFTGDPLAPSGAIKANVLDMARYMITQVNRGVAPDGTRVVSEKNLIETWQPHIDTGDNVDYALGWEVGRQAEAGVIWHEGSYDSFSSVLVFIPETKSALVVLTNLDDPDDFLAVVRQEFTDMINTSN
ncbi:MAG: serine hydrolase domain-containing protein [Chloroflexota bacterium]